MTRGEIYRYSPPGEKPRPVLVLARASAIGYLSSVIVAELTTTIRQHPTSIPVGPEDGLDEVCAINLFALRSVRKEHLRGPAIRLDDGKMRSVERALLYALGLDGYHL
jgi:mRNA interferase MazF